VFFCALGALLAPAASSSASHPLLTAVEQPYAPFTDMPIANDRIRAITKYTRIILYWRDIAPTRPSSPTNPNDPAYNWVDSRADMRVNGALAAGLTPLVTIWKAPRWAEDRSVYGGEAGTVDPSPQAFGDFARAIAAHYPGVHLWEAWNESNLDHFLTPQVVNDKLVAPIMYRDLLNSFYAGIHSVDPGATVVAGGLARRFKIPPLQFMRKLFCLSATLKRVADCPVHLDAWSHHPYTNGGPFGKQGSRDGVSLGDLPKMRKTLAAAKASGNALTSQSTIPFWVSEFSWDTDGPDPDAVPMKLHARWVSEALYQAWRSGVSFFVWHQLRDRPFPATQYQSGLYFCGKASTRDDVGGKCADSGFIERDVAKSASLRSFRFPFVAYPKNGYVQVWGRTVDGASHSVVIQRKLRTGWTKVKTLTADTYGIFALRWRSADTTHLYRAQAGGSTSNSFSLRRPRRISLPNTWGCGGPFPCK
jgi:hypothetical protein